MGDNVRKAFQQKGFTRRFTGANRLPVELAFMTMPFASGVVVYLLIFLRGTLSRPDSSLVSRKVEQGPSPSEVRVSTRG